MDPRAERTTRAIHRAVLELAGQQPIEAVTVTEVARAAGITRGSFYNHATSPIDVLVAALGDELDAAGEVFLVESSADGASRLAAFERNIARVWAHIDSRQDIYRQGLGEHRSPALYSVLTNHFAVQLSAFLTENLSFGMVDPTDEQRDVLRSLYASHAAHGAVGIIETWLRFDVTPDRDLLATASAHAVPEWWFDRPATKNTAIAVPTIT